MMDYECFAGTTQATCEHVAFKDAQLQSRIEVRTVWLARRAILPSWVSLALHSVRHGLTQFRALGRFHESVAPLLAIFGHALSRAIPARGCADEKCTANRAYLVSDDVAPVFVHGVSRSCQSRGTNPPRPYLGLRLRSTMTRMFLSVFQVTIITAKRAQVSFVRASAVQAIPLKSLRLVLACGRAELAITGYCRRYRKHVAALRTCFGNFTAPPMWIQFTGSCLAPSIIASPTTEVVITPGLPKLGVVLLAACAACNLDHRGKYIICCEVKHGF